MAKYANFCLLQRKSDSATSPKDQLKLIRDSPDIMSLLKGPISTFDPNQSTQGIEGVSVTPESVEKYREAVMCAIQGPKMPSAKDLEIYNHFVQRKQDMTGAY